MRRDPAIDASDGICTMSNPQVQTVNLNGTWKLQVQDRFRKNVGSLNNWSIEF